jgi:Zn-dependent M28 family amino/carboxypeptidase
MKYKQISLAVLLSATILTGCGQSDAIKVVTEQVDADNIKAHMDFLADDTLLGRDTGSPGHQIAANYVKSHFKQNNMVAMGNHGGFEQIVTLRETTIDIDSAMMSIENAEGLVDLTFAQDFMISGSKLVTESAIKAETVFVGYGVVSAKFGLDDYQGIDVNGKIVVVLHGRPNKLPSEEGAHIGSGHEKRRHAVERGAVGFITVHTPKREKIRTFAKSAKSAGNPSMTWLTKDNMPFDVHPQLKGIAYVNSQQAKDLFHGSKRNLEDIFVDDNQNKAIKGFALNSKVTLSINSKHSKVTSPNIIASIEGSDAQLKNEYVVFSAHLDHIGVDTNGDNEDKINNGALDNASGVSILLETARLMSNRAEKPKRSVLFVVVTGEERGLLGSSYFANNPTVPVMQMVANVNLDMPMILYPFADVIAFGSTHSSLADAVSKAAQKIDISLSPDPMPEEALFTRSDHYSFVKAGIPSVFLMTGFKSKDPAFDGGKEFGNFLKNHYHQHSDEISLPINYDAAASFAEVNLMIGLEIANGDNRPSWNKDDFFGKIFAQ